MESANDVAEISKEGWMRTTMSKMSKINRWADRYFVLRGPILYFYLKSTDTDPKGHLVLSDSCRISEIRSDSGKKSKQFVFSITWPADLESPTQDKDKDDNGQLDATGADSPNASKGASNKKRSQTAKKKDEKSPKERSTLSGGKVAALTVGGVVVGAMTAGIGLIAGMMVVGAAAGGGAFAASQGSAEKEKILFLACESYPDAKVWVDALEMQIRALSMADGVLGLSYLPGTRVSTDPTRRHEPPPPPEVRLEEVEDWINSTRWKTWAVKDGVRIFEQAFADERAYSSSSSSSSSSSFSGVDSNLPPCLKINVGVNGSALDVMAAMIEMPAACRTGVIKSIRVIETINNCTDIIHIILEPIFVYPTWTAPRDFCLMRYWKHDRAGGSSVVCLDSTYHHDCPLLVGHIRADLHAVYTISPPKMGQEGEYDEEHTDCLLSLTAQMDPKGWIWRSFGFQHEMLAKFLLHLLDIRDKLDTERFVQVHFDPVTEHAITQVHAQNNKEAVEEGTVGTIPAPILPAEMWGDVDASTFRVRSRSYCVDKVKTTSAPAIFKLIAIDVFETAEPTSHIAAHPKNRVALAQQRGEKSWVFIVNIMVPGPPHYSFVVYMEGDKSKFEEDTPFGRLARPFFNGNDDEFRNNRFKLIPKIIDGNMIIKMAVKDTPAIIGNKLKQYYFKGDNYFELDVDVTSSSVARNITGLAIGYSKTIVVDMAFCLQGNEESELPEVLLGGCSCIRVDCTKAKKL